MLVQCLNSQLSHAVKDFALVIYLEVERSLSPLLNSSLTSHGVSRASELVVFQLFRGLRSLVGALDTHLIKLPCLVIIYCVKYMYVYLSMYFYWVKILPSSTNFLLSRRFLFTLHNSAPVEEQYHPSGFLWMQCAHGGDIRDIQKNVSAAQLLSWGLSLLQNTNLAEEVSITNSLQGAGERLYSQMSLSD